MVGARRRDWWPRRHGEVCQGPALQGTQHWLEHARAFELAVDGVRDWAGEAAAAAVVPVVSLFANDALTHCDCCVQAVPWMKAWPTKQTSSPPFMASALLGVSLCCFYNLCFARARVCVSPCACVSVCVSVCLCACLCVLNQSMPLR